MAENHENNIRGTGQKITATSSTLKPSKLNYHFKTNIDLRSGNGTAIKIFTMITDVSDTRGRGLTRADR